MLYLACNVCIVARLPFSKKSPMVLRPAFSQVSSVSSLHKSSRAERGINDMAVLERPLDICSMDLYTLIIAFIVLKNEWGGLSNSHSATKSCLGLRPAAVSLICVQGL